GGPWSSWYQVGTTAITGKPAIAVSNDGHLIFAARRQSDNHVIWNRESASGAIDFSTWPELTSYLIAASDASLSLAGSQLMIAVYGANSSVYDNTYTGAWGSWNKLGGQIQGNPAAFTGLYSVFHVFVHGLSSPPPGDALWDNVAGTWYLDYGVLSNDPVPTQIGSDYHVFVRGTDGALWDYSSATSHWSSLGGQLR
ncbi:MAG: hypothetical protein ACREOM_11890, partial [Candidatus Dormibacteraceae bacterium]